MEVCNGNGMGLINTSLTLLNYSLTNWSKQEPAAIKRSTLGNTDHWSKTKHKNVTLFTTGTDKSTNFFPGERCPHEIPPPGMLFETDKVKIVN